MKIPQTHSKKPLIVAAIITGAVIVAVAAYLWFAKPFAVPSANITPAPQNTVNYGPPTEQEQKDSQEAKQQALENEENPPAAGTIAITISRASQVGTQVSVRTLVTGVTSGNCTYRFIRDGQPTLAKTFSITKDATSTTCNGDVPAADFAASGDWQLSITATDGNSTSSPATQKVTVTK